MKSIRMLAAATIVAIGSIAGLAAPAGARSSFAEGTVTSLRVVPTAGRADVVVGVAGNITLKHFTLNKPERIVVDIAGATLGLTQGESYDGVARGGITKITYSQFSKSVVRIVLTLDAPHTYDVARDADGVHVSVEGAGETFEAWQLGAVEAPLAKVTVPAAEVAPKSETAVAPQAKAEAKVEQAGKPARDFPNEMVRKYPGAPAVQQPSRQPHITVTWENANIADVLASFSASFNRTILPSKAVVGTISATIIDQPWDVALKGIMNVNGYDVSEDANGIIYVDTFDHIAERQATIPLGSKTIRLNYSKAVALVSMVRERLTRACPLTNNPAGTGLAGAAGVAPAPVIIGAATASCPIRGAVTADSITNSISITDIPSALPDLESYVKGLDLRQPQVNIKAKIVLVDRTQLEGLGLRYDLGSQRQFFSDVVPRLDSVGTPLPSQILLGGNTISAIANAAQRVPSAALQLVYSSAIGNFDVTTFLEAMQQSALLDVQAEPSASVLNNRTANLTAGTQVPIRVIDVGTAGGNTAGQAPRANVAFQQTGVILIVTPQITNNRQIQMKVHVENSDVQFQANDVGAVFPKQQVDNEVLVADGETAVMGGLTQTTVRLTRSGIPFLMDLPIIGKLFGVTNRQETKRDLLILITPHIIDEGQAPPPERP